MSLRLTKAGGGTMGPGAYVLRVGGCEAHIVERARWNNRGDTASYTFRDVDFRGRGGDEKLFCVTKSAEVHDVWWWSNIAVVGGRDERICP